MCIVTNATCTVCGFPDLSFDDKGHLAADISKLDENVWGPLLQYLNGPIFQVDRNLDTVAHAVFKHYGLLW